MVEVCGMITDNIISREQYLNALEVVDTYHRQKEEFKVKASSIKSIRNLDVGDFVYCRYVNGANKRCLTKGKSYEVCGFTQLNNKRNGFHIVDDNNKFKTYDIDNVQFSAL